MSRPIRLTRLHLLIAMTVVVSVVFSGMRFTLLLDAVHQDASKSLIGLLGALVSLFPTLLSLRVGRRIDQRGPRQPMLLACLVLVACGGAGFFQDGMAVLFFIAIFGGIANNTWTIAHQQMVGAFSRPGERATGYSLSALGFAIGALAAPVLSGFSIQHIGFAGTYAWQGLLPLIPLLVIGLNRLRLPEGSRAGDVGVTGTTLVRAKPADAGAPDGPGDHPDDAAPASSRHNVFDLLRSPILIEVYIVGTLFEASWTLFAFLTPIYGAQLGLSSSTIGVIAGSISITSILVRAILPFLIQRVPPWRLLIASLLILGMGYLGFSLSGTVTLLITFALMLGIGQAIGAPIVNALLYDQAPPGRSAEAVGLRSTLNNGCQTILPLISGALSAALGIAPAFWLLSVALLAGFLKVRRRWHRPLHSRLGDGS